MYPYNYATSLTLTFLSNTDPFQNQLSHLHTILLHFSVVEKPLLLLPIVKILNVQFISAFYVFSSILFFQVKYGYILLKKSAFITLH